MECARELCESLGVRFETVSYPELGFKEMDDVVQKIADSRITKRLVHIVGYFVGKGSTTLLKELEQM